MDKFENVNDSATANPRDASDAAQLLDIFPKKVWVEILKNISDPQDLENISRASPFFRDLLKEKHIFYLFPKVFEVLNLYHLKNAPSSHSGNVCKPKSRQVNANKGNASPFLVLRTVCKSWCNSIDNFYQHHPSHFKTTFNRLCRDFCQFSGNTHVNFSLPSPHCDKKQIHDFLEHFQETHSNSTKNPFISRSISFVDTHDWLGTNRPSVQQMTNDGKFWFGIDRVLSEYGHHVWYCDILLENKMGFSYQRNLREWLEYMPNLKALNIWYAQKHGYKQVQLLRQGKKISSYDPEEIYSWDMEIDRHPIAKLKQLQFIRVAGLPTPISYEFFVRNDHVTYLNMDSFTKGLARVNYAYYWPSTVSFLPKLENFKWKICWENEIEQMDECGVEWPLKTLEVDFCVESFRGDIYWSRLFDIMSKNWSGTLTDVTLNMPAPELGKCPYSFLQEHKSLSLDLPNVQRLKLTMWDWLPIDFILPMKSSLEHLDVAVCKYSEHDFVRRNLGRAEAEEQIEFVKCREGKYLECNIWNIFSNLKSLRIVVKSNEQTFSFFKSEYYEREFFYTRGQWEK